MSLPVREYEDSMTISDALQLYFSKYHFVNGGYDLKWFRIKIGPVYIPLPNTKGRVAAVRIHDIHHILTEYKANLRGEAQIGAWELAGGCGKYFAAWLLNFGSFSYGLIFFPRTLLASFLSGCAIRKNLYYNVIYDEALLSKTVGELRTYTGVAHPRQNITNDYILFFAWAIGSIVYMLLFFMCVFLAIRWFIHLF